MTEIRTTPSEAQRLVSTAFDLLHQGGKTKEDKAFGSGAIAADLGCANDIVKYPDGSFILVRYNPGRNDVYSIGEDQSVTDDMERLLSRVRTVLSNTQK